MLIYSMTTSIDGFVSDRSGGVDWGAPSDELFAVHLARVRGLGAHLCGRRLYETMLPWETDPSMRETALGAAFAEVWAALPKVVFSRTLTSVVGNARLATGSVAEEVSRALHETDRGVEIGGAKLAAAALELDLVDEMHVFRAPVLLGGGAPMFHPLDHEVPFELAEARSFASGIVHQRYRRLRV